jgi:hypothetical protein
VTWVRRQQPKHECAPPVNEGDIPGIRAAGSIGDLWRCDTCQKLWRVADANEGQRGRVTLGSKWMPATRRQRIRHYWDAGKIYPDDVFTPDIEDPPRQTGTDWLYTVEEKRA